MTQLDDLPDELLITLFSYLRLVDRKTTRLVCQRWYSLNYCFRLIENDITYVQSYLLLDNFISPIVKHANLKITVEEESVDLSTLQSMQFWLQHAQNVKSVAILHLRTNVKILGHLFENCCNYLQCLSLSDMLASPGLFKEENLCISNFNFYFPKLVSLNLTYLSHWDFSTLCAITDRSPQLQKITVHSWHGVKFTNSESDFLLYAVTKQAVLLKEFGVSFCNITDEYLKELLTVLGPQLVGLYLEASSRSFLSSLPMIANKFLSLKKIALMHYVFEETELLNFLSNLSNLTHVRLSNLPQLTDASIVSLKHLPHLTSLDLSHCFQLTSQGIKALFSAELRPKMNDLRLFKVFQITDDLFEAIAPNLPNLTYLGLSGCPNLTDISLEVIFLHNKLVQHLCLAMCPRFKNVCVGNTINALKGLIYLDVSYCRCIVSSIQNLQLLELQTLDLTGVNVSAMKVSDIILGCPSLQKLYVEKSREKVLRPFQRKLDKKFIYYGTRCHHPDSFFN